MSGSVREVLLFFVPSVLSASDNQNHPIELKSLYWSSHRQIDLTKGLNDIV